MYQKPPGGLKRREKAGNMKSYRNREGKKLYPVCSWEQNQHKIYNANDRAYNWLHDTCSDEAAREFERTQHLLEVFDQYVIEVFANGKMQIAENDEKALEYVSINTSLRDEEE